MEVGVRGPVSHSSFPAQHGMMQRLHTSVPPQSPRLPSQAHHSSAGTGTSSYSIQSGPSSRSSATTYGNSTNSFTSSSVPSSTFNSAFGGPPMHQFENVMNKVGEKEQSLFQICMQLRQRLKGVSNFDVYFQEEEQDLDVDHESDPVDLMWRTFRRGYPLLALYNVLRADKPIQPDLSTVASEIKRGKTMTFKFLNALIHDLKFRVEDCFIVLDLYGDDTTGFVKVTKTVTRLLDVLLERGLIEDTRRELASTSSSGQRSQRQHIVDELVNTERTYVQQLELLQAFQKQCQDTGVIPGDVIHSIFLNLNGLLDFQRRFLIRVEQINALAEEKQNWGRLFSHNGDLFDIYEPYITNQKQCEETVMRHFDKLRMAGGSPELQGIVANPSTLYGFLMKPFQRLSKYPLLLNELYKKGEYDEMRRQDLLDGKQCATDVLTRTNTAMDRQDKAAAVQELKGRVEQWKGHRVEGFGELLLFGQFTVIKSDGQPNKDSEREYHVYFFESILLCCKDHDPTRIKVSKSKNKPVTPKPTGPTKLQLKGRIFMQNVTNIVAGSKPGSYTCQIFWKGDPGIESFTIRFLTEEQMNNWHAKLQDQQRKYHEAVHAENLRQAGTSSTEFTYFQNQGHLENPYRDTDDDEESGMANTSGSYASSSETSAWTTSRASMRSRSATGESVQRPTSGRQNGPRFAPGSLPAQPLHLRDQRNSGAASPAMRFQDSYFSPSLDSPMSSRASTSSGMYFPRASTGLEAGGSILPHRAASRETMGSTVSHPQSARGLSARPSFPAGSSGSSTSLSLGSRNRSASSPNIDDLQRRPQTTSHPPLPDGGVGMASKLHHSASVARSATNSPHLSGGIDEMMGESSPRLQRERSHTPSYSGPGYAMDPALQRIPSAAGRNITPVPYGSREFPVSPPLQSATSIVSADSSLSPMSQPTQLKVKVHVPAVSQTLTLVVPVTISYQTLKDRIDAKLQRSSSLTLSDRGGANQVKLKYLDEEDYINISSDEDVQNAFETWREQKSAGGSNSMGEVELFCHGSNT